MKKIEKGLITLLIIGLSFFFLRWPFASEFLILSIGSLALLYMYFGTILFNDIPIKNILKTIKSKSGRSAKLIAGFLLGFLLAINIIGSLFKFMNWPFAMNLIFISLAFMIIILIASIILSSKNNSVFYKNVILRFGLWGMLSLMLTLLPKYAILEYRYAKYPTYIEAFKYYNANPTDENFKLMEEEFEKTLDTSE